MYNISPIYAIFIVIILLIAYFVKNKRTSTILLMSLFIFFFVFSNVGPDYEGYGVIYNNALNSESDLHGEPLFLGLIKLFKLIGIPYNIFRIIFLVLSLSILFYSTYKLSKNFLMSFIIFYLVYICYLISAYRQLFTMAILLLSLYLLFNKNKKLTVLILNLVAIFIHRLAIIQFLVFAFVILYDYLKNKKNFNIKINKLTEYICKLKFKKLLIVVGVCFLVRVFVSFLIKLSFIQEIFDFIPYFSEVSLFNLGLLSRVAMFFIMYYLYNNAIKDKFNSFLYYLYMISLLLYFIVPLDLLMGRLINNFKLLEVILIPNLLHNSKIVFNKYKHNYFLHKEHLVVAAIFFVSSFVFISQMTFQVGYNPIVHFIFG